MIIRRFEESDAEKVSQLIRTTIEISNKKDYPEELMDELIKTETPEHVLGRSGWTHMYVVLPLFSPYNQSPVTGSPSAKTVSVWFV